jgi:hypothetical protein
LLLPTDDGTRYGEPGLLRERPAGGTVEDRHRVALERAQHVQVPARSLVHVLGVAHRQAAASRKGVGGQRLRQPAVGVDVEDAHHVGAEARHVELALVEADPRPARLVVAHVRGEVLHLGRRAAVVYGDAVASLDECRLKLVR